MLNCKLKYVLFSLLCIFVSPFIVKADCSYERQAELSRLASNVQIAYTYDSVQFTVYMSNLTSDLYVADNYNQIYYGNGEEKKFEYASGTINFDIYSNDKNCYGEKILRKTITLPTINTFATYKECNQYPNFKYCQNWGELAISDEQFYKEFNEYVQDVNGRFLAVDDGKIDFFGAVAEIFENNKFMFYILFFVVILSSIFIFVRQKLHK